MEALFTKTDLDGDGQVRPSLAHSLTINCLARVAQSLDGNVQVAPLQGRLQCTVHIALALALALTLAPAPALQVDVNEWLLYGARRERSAGQAKENARQKEKLAQEATEQETVRRRQSSYLQAVDGGGAAPLMLEYVGIRGEVEEEEEAEEEVPSSMGSARRQLLLTDSDFMDDAERNSSPGMFAVTRRSHKKRWAEAEVGGEVGGEVQRLGLASPPRGAAPAAAVPPQVAAGWRRDDVGTRQRRETPRQGSSGIEHAQAAAAY